MISYGVFSENRSTDLPFANKKDIEILDNFSDSSVGALKVNECKYRLYC